MLNPLSQAGVGVQLVGQGINYRRTMKDLASAEENLKAIQSRGVTSTLTPEMQNAMMEAMRSYNKAKQDAMFGLTSEQTSAAMEGINRAETGQIQAARDAGGGQMARFINAATGSNKSANLLNLASQDAALKMQKEQFAASQLNPVLSAAGQIQATAERDTDRYQNLLREAGKAISDLRMQRNENTQAMFNTVGLHLQKEGDKLDQAAFAMLGANTGGTGGGGVSGGVKTPTTNTYGGADQNTKYGSFSDYGTLIS